MLLLTHSIKSLGALKWVFKPWQSYYLTPQIILFMWCAL